MNADEVVRIDEAVKALHRLSVLLVTPDSIVCCEAADLIESLQSQLSESQRRERAAVEMNEDNRVRLLQYDNLRKCFSELCDLILGRKYYNEAMDAYRADEFCCRDIWDKVKPMLSRKQWRGPQAAGKGEK